MQGLLEVKRIQCSYGWAVSYPSYELLVEWFCYFITNPSLNQALSAYMFNCNCTLLDQIFCIKSQASQFSWSGEKTHIVLHRKSIALLFSNNRAGVMRKMMVLYVSFLISWLVIDSIFIVVACIAKCETYVPGFMSAFYTLPPGSLAVTGSTGEKCLTSAYLLSNQNITMIIGHGGSWDDCRDHNVLNLKSFPSR